jgi:chromosome segregation ATPase
VAKPSNNDDFKKENAKLRSELARLKSAVSGAPLAPDGESDEMAKLVADAKAIRGLAKESPILANALAALEARISELRATRLSVKPPSERMRQLEAEAKRKQKDIESIQKRRAAALERIAKEQAAIADLDAVAAASAASIAKLQEKISQLAAEVQAKATSDPPQGDEAMDADTANTEARKPDGDIQVETATSVAAELGIEGGAKRVMEIIAAASAATKKTRTGL